VLSATADRNLLLGVQAATTPVLSATAGRSLLLAAQAARTCFYF